MGCPLLTGNRATATLEYKLVKVLTPHKLGHTIAQLNLAIPKGLDLSLKRTDLVINANPLAECVTDFVGHL